MHLLRCMKYICLLLSLSLLLSISSKGASVCRVENGVFYGADRLKIHLHFGLHGPSTKASELFNALFDQKTRSKGELEKMIRIHAEKLLAFIATERWDGRPALPIFSRDQERLQDVVLKNSSLEWIAIEQPEGSDDDLMALQSMVRAIISILRNSKMESEKAILAVQLLMPPGIFQAALRDSSLEPIQLFGIDDSPLVKALHVPLQEESQILERLNELERSGQYREEWKNEFSVLIEEPRRKCPISFCETSWDSAQKYIRESIKDPEIQRLLLKFIEADKVIAVGSIQRNKTIASRLLDKIGEGSLALGIHHKEGIEHELVTQCLARESGKVNLPNPFSARTAVK